MSNVNSMSTAFQATDVSEIVGLSTWGATAGSVNMQRAFWNSDHLSFLDNDNSVSYTHLPLPTIYSV